MDNTFESIRCWYRITPDRVLVALLTLECFLLLSEWFCWFDFNWRRGQTVLIALVAVGLTLLLMLFWLAAARLLDWRFQFSLRSLLFLVVAIAVGCGWLVTEIFTEKREGEVARAIRKAGGIVVSRPTLLGKLLQNDLLVEVYDVTLGGPQVTDAVLLRLQGLKRLLGLELINSKITDVGLMHLRGMKELRELRLDGAQVTDVGLVYIQGLNQLQILDLNSTKVTDAGLVHLHGLNQLRILRLDGTQITDAGLVHLEGLSRLQDLDLSNTKITDAGLVHLRGLSQLIELLLYGTKVTDQGIDKLEQAVPHCVSFK